MLSNMACGRRESQESGRVTPRCFWQATSWGRMQGLTNGETISLTKAPAQNHLVGETGLSSHPLSLQGLSLESKPPTEGRNMVRLHPQSLEQ